MSSANNRLAKKPNRLYELDCVRGLAALAVMLFHYTCRYRNLFGDSIIPRWMDFPIGRYGIEVFFILSGFVIIFTIKRNLSVQRFISKRFFRLYPTYWLCTIVTFTFVAVIGLPSREVTFGQFLINLSMLQYGLKIKAVDGVTWALFMELMFYFYIAGILAIRQVSKIKWLCWAWFFLIVLKIFFPIPILKILAIGDYGVFFIAGINFYHIYESSHLNRSCHLLNICCFVTACALSETPLRIAAIVIMFTIFYFFAYGKLKWIVSNQLIFLGNISYPLYLLHQNIGYIFIKKTATLTGQPYLALLVPCLFSILAAWIVYRFFEGAVVKKMQDFFSKEGRRTGQPMVQN